MPIEVTGSAKLRAVTAALREAGDRSLRLELNKAIRAAAKPAHDAIRASAASRLPRRGGLAGNIAASKLQTTIKTGSQSAGVTIKATSGHAIGKMDAGRLMHPVWGGPAWTAQAITPGWWSQPLQDLAAPIGAEIERALDRVADRIAKA